MPKGNPNPAHKFKKGKSANPGGKKKENPIVKDLLAQACPDIAKRLIAIALHSEDEAIAVNAGKYIYDRIHGKPRESVDMNVAGEVRVFTGQPYGPPGGNGGG